LSIASTWTAPQDHAYDILGVRLNALDLPGTIQTIEHWIQGPPQTRFVAVMNVHMLMMAKEDPGFGRVVASSDVTVPDGMPLIWSARRKGVDQQRVYGPELFAEFFRATEGRGYRHFFYGGRPEMLDELVRRIKTNHPDTSIVGAYAPPFRALTPAEDAEVVSMINNAQPDLIWVGIGCPKQERWIDAHRTAFSRGVMLGVGQAFDIYAGLTKQAPSWMQSIGLEWLYRLCSEPRRLWRRYLVYNTRFVVATLAAAMGR
jgi:N-acetylglucosaminyldiphosphoundecaprenol N-acetyl-beta-D-mannosaminyltransferase